jgi:hypothetical protein
MNIKSFITLIPSLLLLIKLFLGEQIKSLRGQGGGVGDRAAVTPLCIRHRRIGSLAVGRLFRVVGGSGDQDGRYQDQQNCDSVMKNIFWELKLSTTTNWLSHQKRFGLNSPFSLSQFFSS